MWCLLPPVSVPWKRKRCSSEARNFKVVSAVSQNRHGHGREHERGDGDEDEDEEEDRRRQRQGAWMQVLCS